MTSSNRRRSDRDPPSGPILDDRAEAMAQAVAAFLMNPSEHRECQEAIVRHLADRPLGRRLLKQVLAARS